MAGRLSELGPGGGIETKDCDVIEFKMLNAFCQVQPPSTAITDDPKQLEVRCSRRGTARNRYDAHRVDVRT